MEGKYKDKQVTTFDGNEKKRREGMASNGEETILLHRDG